MLALALGLSGCAIGSSGEVSRGFLKPEIGAAYIPLHVPSIAFNEYGAGVVIAPGIAVTNAHNQNLVDANAVIAKDTDFDLLYFRTSKSLTLPVAAPVQGEQVIAYGEGTDGGLREAVGTVVLADAELHGFTFAAEAGPGFSGGPVVDAHTGALLGITFGYKDGEPGVSGRLMFAYDMNRVGIERAALKAHAAAQ